MDWEFDYAPDGNIALTGELGLDVQREFTMGLAFGNTQHRAITTLFQALGYLSKSITSAIRSNGSALALESFRWKRSPRTKGTYITAAYGILALNTRRASEATSEIAVD
jgi:glucodextranase-like protein